MQRTLANFFTKASYDVTVVTNENLSNNDSQPIHKTPKKKDNRNHQKIQDRWFTMFKWFETNDERNKLFCKICRDAKMENKFATEGASNCQLSTLYKHNESREHKNAESTIQLRMNKVTQKIHGVSVSVDSESTSDEETSENQIETGTLKVFRTVYKAAKCHLPNDCINDLLDLQRENGLDIPFRDLSCDSVSQIQDSLVSVLDGLLESELRSVSCYGIIVDESCDISVDKKLGIYIRYVSLQSKDVNTKFLCNASIPDGKSETIRDEIIKVIKSIGLSCADLVGLGSDGASVMTGRSNGVGTRLKQDAPALVHIHCLAHRVSLASSQAAADFPFLQEIKSTLLSLYNYFKYSAVRYNKLRELQDVYNEPSLKLKEPTQIRWLPVHSAISTVCKIYQSLITCLEQDVVTKKDPKATGILKHLQNYKFVGALHYLNDVLDVLKCLSLKLQENQTNFATITNLVDMCVGRLGALNLNGGGESYKGFLENIEEKEGQVYFKGICLMHSERDVVDLMDKYIEKVKDNLLQRLAPSDNTRDLLEGLCSVFDPSVVRELDHSDLNIHLKNIELHYCSGDTPYIEPGKLLPEWPVLHSLLLGSYRKYNPQQVCKTIIFKHTTDFPNFSRLSEAALCIYVTSVACERGFSLQNKLKTKARSSLSSDSLEKLMKMSVGPESSSFPFVKAVQHWNKCKRRRYGALEKRKKTETETKMNTCSKAFNHL